MARSREDSGVTASHYDALQSYIRTLLTARLPTHMLASYAENLLSGEGHILSATPHSVLAAGALVCAECTTGERWQQTVPAAAALDLTNTAIELLDKCFDEEPLGDVPPSAEMLNLASCLQGLAHVAIADLESSGVGAEVVAQAHGYVDEVVLEIGAGQHWDITAERKWLSVDDALALGTAKSAPLGAAVGSLGAILSADEFAKRQCREFGRLVAIYAQIVNDLNDVKPGSTLKSDIRKRKSTLPIAYFVRETEQEFAGEKALLKGEAPLTRDQELAIRDSMFRSGALDYCGVLAEIFRARAREALDPLRGKYDMSPLEHLFLA